jgi:hypothetical protein
MAVRDVSKAMSEKVDTSAERLSVYLRRAEQDGDTGPPIKLDLSRVSREALEESCLTTCRGSLAAR